MKSNKIVSSIKTTSVVLSAAFTLNSCNDKPLSESQYQNVQHKTDSAANSVWEYRMASGLVDLIESQIKNYRNINKILLKKYTIDHIKRNVKDTALAKFMLDAINNEDLISVSNYVIESDDTCVQNINENTLSTLLYIYHHNRWYNDLMLYLSGKYSEQQLLKSEFFTVVNDKKLKKNFEYNTQQIEKISSQIDFPLNRRNTIRAEFWNKYAKEAHKQR